MDAAVEDTCDQTLFTKYLLMPKRPLQCGQRKNDTRNPAHTKASIHAMAIAMNGYFGELSAMKSKPSKTCNTGYKAQPDSHDEPFPIT